MKGKRQLFYFVLYLVRRVNCYCASYVHTYSVVPIGIQARNFHVLIHANYESIIIKLSFYLIQ